MKQSEKYKAIKDADNKHLLLWFVGIWLGITTVLLAYWNLM